MIPVMKLNELMSVDGFECGESVSRLVVYE